LRVGDACRRGAGRPRHGGVEHGPAAHRSRPDPRGGGRDHGADREMADPAGAAAVAAFRRRAGRDFQGDALIPAMRLYLTEAMDAGRLNRRRFLFFSAIFALTSVATWFMADLLWRKGITGVELAVLALFVILFAHIAAGFCT